MIQHRRVLLVGLIPGPEYSDANKAAVLGRWLKHQQRLGRVRGVKQPNAAHEPHAPKRILFVPGIGMVMETDREFLPELRRRGQVNVISEKPWLVGETGTGAMFDALTAPDSEDPSAKPTKPEQLGQEGGAS